MAKSLFRKRVQTVAAISTASLGTAVTSAAPAPTLELPKQGVIAAGDIALCITIYAIWYDNRITKEEMTSLLLDAGIISVVAGGLVYGGVKLTEGLLAEGLNLLGPIGWGVSGTITGSVTAAVGLTFWALCETEPQWLSAAQAR